VFTLFHLAHFTFAWVTTAETPDANGILVRQNYLDMADQKGRQNVYE